MSHPNPEHKNQVIEWARSVLSNASVYAILDTETTGLGKKDVIIQIAAIDPKRNVLLDTLVKPTSRKTIAKEATVVHGIAMDMLREEPTFEFVYPKLRKIMNERNLVIYNAAFDTRIITQTAVYEGIPEDFKVTGECAMLVYSAFVGDWSDYHENYTYQKLPSINHTALGDCYATLDIIEKMANTELEVIPKKKFRFRL